jgi:hypothetical protein
MKPQKVLIHANCARTALKTLLRAMNPQLEIKTTYNVSKEGILGFMEACNKWRPQVILFQEHIMTRAESLAPGSGFPDFVRMIRKQIPTVSWCHPHNSAIWPWAKKTAAALIDDKVKDWRMQSRLFPGDAAFLRRQAGDLAEARAKWTAGSLNFDFGRRLGETQRHHDDNEARFQPVVKTGPWLKENLRRIPLWWSTAHPTAEVHLEIGRQICAHVGWTFKRSVCQDWPGDWIETEEAWPHSRYDHEFFRFNFWCGGLARAADAHWRSRLTEIWPS